MTFSEFVFLACALVGLVAINFHYGCSTTNDEAQSTLEKAGFTEIVLKPEVEVWACGEGDKWGRSFEAANPHGVVVSGVVCCGRWKACTIRF
jgi:hypothetical protein